MSATTRPSVPPVTRWPGRLGGAAGVAFVVLALAGNSLTGGGPGSEAEPEAFATEVSRRTADAAWRAGITIELLAFLALVVFAAALATRIRAVEPADSYAGTLVLAGGLLLVAVKLASGSAIYAADLRSGDIDGELARMLHDLNGAAFVLSFVPLALLLAAASAGALAHAALPRALGWAGPPVAVLLVVAAATGADAIPVPFLLALLWLLATGVVMLSRPNLP